MEATNTFKVEDLDGSTYEANMYFTDNGNHLIIAIYFPMGGWVILYSIEEFRESEEACGDEGQYDIVDKIEVEWNKFCEEYK